MVSSLYKQLENTYGMCYGKIVKIVEESDRLYAIVGRDGFGYIIQGLVPKREVVILPISEILQIILEI